MRRRMMNAVTALTRYATTVGSLAIAVSNATVPEAVRAILLAAMASYFSSGVSSMIGCVPQV